MLSSLFGSFFFILSLQSHLIDLYDGKAYCWHIQSVFNALEKRDNIFVISFCFVHSRISAFSLQTWAYVKDGKPTLLILKNVCLFRSLTGFCKHEVACIFCNSLLTLMSVNVWTMTKTVAKKRKYEWWKGNNNLIQMKCDTDLLAKYFECLLCEANM